VSRILIIEDDPAIQFGLKENLGFESYDVEISDNAESGYEMISENPPDLIILDVMLPGMNGYELCRKLRGEGVSIPILMLTARGEEFDRVMGLDLGADDYVTKPFSVMEVMARVRALLRRVDSSSELPDTINFGDVVVDFKKYEVKKAQKPVNLARKEYGILRLLASRAGEVVTRDELLDHVWGHNEFPSSRTVDAHVATMRAKLENNPSKPEHLITMHGVGYKLIL
jgi:DNA-binding response OmpR family regulator